MNLIRSIFLVLPIALWSSASAETMRFEDSAAMLAAQKRVAARAAVTKLCARDVTKFCGDVPRGDSGKALECLLAGPRGVTINCNKAIADAGYR